MGSSRLSDASAPLARRKNNKKKGEKKREGRKKQANQMRRPTPKVRKKVNADTERTTRPLFL